jgi:phosphopantetheinyl transferase
MIFSEVIPEPTPAGEFALQAERRSTWAADGLYRDGMFHGPAFQGVLSLDRIGDDGAEATLAVGSTDDFFRSDPHPAFITDPVLLDQPGQVVGLWTAECLDTAYVIFPFYLEALHLYAYPKTAERARCRARIHLIGEQRVRSDLDIIGLDERVWARLVGWEDRRFDLPRAFHRFLLSPQEVTLSQPWPAPVASLPSPADLLVYRLSLDDFPKDFFFAHGGLWGRVLAHLILSRRERALWRSLRSPELRRIEWLLGRVAAKDAVREHVRRRHAMALCPADVEILPDENGRPLVRGSWVERLPCAPTVSLSHSGGVAVAAVGLGEAGAAVGVGIDIERVGHMRDEAEGVAFTPPEQELLSSVRQAAPDEWPLRLWCAKEAAAKALGHGLRGGPQALVVQALDASRGMVHLVPAGELARRAQERNTDSTLTAFTVREDGLIAAVCLGGVERPTTEK